MKKIITAAIAIILAAGTSAFAGDKKENPVRSQKANYQIAFSKIAVEDDIDVVLVENPEKSIEFTGTDADMAKLEWKIKDDVLYISSKKGSLRGKVKITVNVSQLKELAVKGECSVTSQGGLNSASLKITIDGDSYVSIRNTGVITVLNEQYTELDVEKVHGEVKFG